MGVFIFYNFNMYSIMKQIIDMRNMICGLKKFDSMKDEHTIMYVD